MSSSRAHTCLPCQLHVPPDFLHGAVTRSAVHHDVIPHALVEVVKEEGLEGLLLLQTWCARSLDVCGSQAPVILSWRCMLPLHDGEGTERSRGVFGIRQILLA